MLPMSTPLYRILVLPASSPSADRKTIVIFGLSLLILATPTQTPTSPAAIGTSQTREGRVRFLGTALDTATCMSSWSGILAPCRAHGIPDQPRVEGLDGEHREHDDRGEEKQTHRRLHRHERLKLHERGGKGVDEHIDHRPASDELDHPVELDALVSTRDRPTLHGNEQVGQRDDLRARNQDARNEHDERERPPGG